MKTAGGKHKEQLKKGARTSPQARTATGRRWKAIMPRFINKRKSSRGWKATEDITGRERYKKKKERQLPEAILERVIGGSLQEISFNLRGTKKLGMSECLQGGWKENSRRGQNYRQSAARDSC